MTNLEKIKSTLCNSILSMSEETLFEFISEYDEDEETYFPKEILFTCSQCHKIYGNCIAQHNTDSIDYNVCKSRFNNYCKLECE